MKRRRQVLSGYIPLAAIPSVPIVEKPLIVETPAERRQREWRESCESEARRVEAARVANLEARRKRAALEQAAQDRKQADTDRKRRQAEFAMQEMLIEDTILRHGLTPAEKDRVMQALLDADFTAEQCEIFCQEIVANRPTPAKLAEVKAKCIDDTEWQRILDVIIKYRHQFSDESVADGTAHKLVYRWIFL